MSRNALQGALELLILTSLAQLGPSHGRAITLYIRDASGQRLKVEDGSLYPALHRMEKRRWVFSYWTRSDQKRRALVYLLTRAGRERLALCESSWNGVVEGVRALLDAA
jgi:transcriptional regulator